MKIAGIQGEGKGGRGGRRTEARGWVEQGGGFQEVSAFVSEAGYSIGRGEVVQEKNDTLVAPENANAEVLIPVNEEERNE